MPQRLSEDVSQVIVHALQRGLSRGQISGVVGVSKRAITRINTNLKKHGSAKAPPSGTKLGRPTKMSREHAEAMLAWMAERDYTFYVKDLVTYLRDNFNYVGCDGTVRRGLIKAGFKRKLPWHKSEVSVWVPPPVPLLPAESSSTNNVIQQTQNLPEHDIDPSLQGSTQRNPEIVESTHHSHSYSHQIPSQVAASHPNPHQILSSGSLPLSQISSELSSSLFTHHVPGSGPQQVQSLPQVMNTPTSKSISQQRRQPMMASSKATSRVTKSTTASKSKAPKSKARIITRQPAAPVMAATTSSTESTPADESGDEPSDFVTQLQRQLLDQKEEIRRLHRQLQAHQSQPMPHQFLEPTPMQQPQHGTEDEIGHGHRDYRSPYLDDGGEV